MTTFCGIRKLIRLSVSHCTAPQHVGESGNDTGTRKCYKDSSHHTKHNCIQRFSQGQSSISLVLHHLFLSLSRSLNCLPCHSWKIFPRKIFPLLFLLGRTSHTVPVFPPWSTWDTLQRCWQMCFIVLGMRPTQMTHFNGFRCWEHGFGAASLPVRRMTYLHLCFFSIT